MTNSAAIKKALDQAEEWDWPKPDLTLLSGHWRPSPKLPTHVFGEMKNWIETCAEHASAPADYVAMAVVGAASSLIGNARWVSPWSGWKEPPILWLCSVGNPSSGKTPAFKPIIWVLDELEREDFAVFEKLLKEYEANKLLAEVQQDVWKGKVKDAVKGGRPPPSKPETAETNEPEPPVIKLNDVTVERLAGKLAAQPKGLLFYRDELAGWAGNLDKYGAGDRGFWLEAYNGGSYTVERVKFSKKPIQVSFLSCSILGTIQPDRLQSLFLKSDDDGLTARFLMCWPETLRPKRPHGMLDSSQLERILRRLKELKMDNDANGKPKPKVVPFSDRAADALQGWRVELAARETDLSGKLLSHVGKMPGMTARFSLILHYLHWATTDEPEPTEVDERFVKEAITLMKEYFIPMAERCYGEAGLPKAERDAVTIAKEIKKRQVNHLNASDLRRTWGLPDLRKADEVSAAINVLEEADILKPNPNRLGDTKGRAKKDYLVNPKFLEAVANDDDANGA